MPRNVNSGENNLLQNSSIVRSEIPAAEDNQDFSLRPQLLESFGFYRSCPYKTGKS